MMSFVKKPIVVGILFFVGLAVICLCISIPMYNGVAVYDQNLVHFEAPVKLSLQHLMGWKLEQLSVNEIRPSEIKMSAMGIAILLLVHLGMPFLFALRFHFAKKKAELNDAE